MVVNGALEPGTEEKVTLCTCTFGMVSIEKYNELLQNSLYTMKVSRP